MCPELMFNPQIKGAAATERAIHDLAWDSIRLSDKEFREDLCGNIILSGGSCKFKGLGDRLSRELKARDPEYTEYLDFNVITPSNT